MSGSSRERITSQRAAPDVPGGILAVLLSQLALTRHLRVYIVMYMSEITSFTEFRNQLAHWLDRVTNNKTELHVTRQGARSVVVVDEAEWSSMVETLHLFSSPANARRLLDTMDGIEAGKAIAFDPTAGQDKPAAAE
jgi:antitoxin YefM